MRPIKILITVLAAACAIALIFQGPVPETFKRFDPQIWLGLSKSGLNHLYFWQIFSYILLPSADADASFGFLLNTGFNFYLLWSISQSFIAQKGQKNFWMLFLGSSIFSGLCAGATLFLTTSTTILTGWTPGLYALLVGWMLLNANGRLHIFARLPIKWIVLGMAAVTLYLDLTAGYYIQCIASFSAIVFAYFYAIIGWQIHSPFEKIKKFEALLHRLRGKKQTKIYDFVDITIQ